MALFDTIKRLIGSEHREAELHEKLEELRKRTPVPVFWLFGKTQSGKTSIIKFLTGADDAEIGQGFQSCTRFSRSYAFPSAEAPLVQFLDTRGLDEPGYDCEEDLAQFDPLAHVVLVTVKLLDHALENLLRQLQHIRARQPHRPIVLAVTCLHEAYPQEQHPFPHEVYHRPDFEQDPLLAEKHPGLVQSLVEQKHRFAGLYDSLVPLDLTPPAEGFNEPNYGGDYLKEVLLAALPAAYRQTLIHLEESTNALQDLYARHALPHIIGYSSLAASAGAIPIPWIDLFVLPGIQTRMIYHLAKLYGQPLTGERFLELAGTLGLGIVMRQATRELVKFIPFVGSVAGAALAASATFALGKAFCYYYSAVHKGHVPKADDLRRYYHEQLALAEQQWKRRDLGAETKPNP